MVGIKSSYAVIPSEATPNGSLLLSGSEQINAHNHALTIYIYRPNHNNPIPEIRNVIDTMKDSLGKILVHYYLLAGRLRMIGGGRMEVECNAEGVKLLEAESTNALEDYGDFEPNDALKGLIPKVDYGEPMEKLPLVLVQVTTFTCGGLSVGFAVSNVIADGIAGTLFVDTWAKLARGGTLGEDEKPFLKRTVLRPQKTFTAPHFDHPEFKPLPMVLGSSDTTVERKKETALAILKLTGEMVEKLKKKANHEFMEYDHEKMVQRRPYSRYESIAAQCSHMEVCMQGTPR